VVPQRPTTISTLRLASRRRARLIQCEAKCNPHQPCPEPRTITKDAQTAIGLQDGLLRPRLRHSAPLRKTQRATRKARSQTRQTSSNSFFSADLVSLITTRYRPSEPGRIKRSSCITFSPYNARTPPPGHLSLEVALLSSGTFWRRPKSTSYLASPGRAECAAEGPAPLSPAPPLRPYHEGASRFFWVETTLQPFSANAGLGASKGQQKGLNILASAWAAPHADDVVLSKTEEGRYDSSGMDLNPSLRPLRA